MPFTDHMQRNRFELKYIIEERTARGVRDFIRTYMVHDEHARPELGYAYPIYSVYLDSGGLDLFNSTVCGHKNRFKLRARYYNGDPKSPVFFEVKRRVSDAILKDRAPIKRSSVKRLLMGCPPEREDLLDPADPEAWGAIQGFCHLQHSLNGKGRTIVGYTREAWNAPDNDDVRVTFDRKLVGAWFNDQLPIDEALRVDRAWVHPPIEGNGTVLELKFTGRFPNWMRDLVRSFDLYRTCMAKYVNCVMALGPQAHGRWQDRRMARLPRESLI